MAQFLACFCSIKIKVYRGKHNTCPGLVSLDTCRSVLLLSGRVEETIISLTVVEQFAFTPSRSNRKTKSKHNKDFQNKNVMLCPLASARVLIAQILFLMSVMRCWSFLPTKPPTIQSYKMILSHQRNWVKDLLEMSTYGPGERKLLKERRRQNYLKEDYDVSLESFIEAKNQNSSDRPLSDAAEGGSDSDETSLKAFQAAVASKADDQLSAGDFDGYAFKDLLVDLWGAPLDVGFERQPRSIHCTVFPVAFGNWKCQHVSELDYLMHLQGVIEILDKYDNLTPFINFLLTTTTTPKPGTAGVRYKLELTEGQLDSILKNKM